jgi:hypothetical protein
MGFVGSAGAADPIDVQHGISFTKGCESPTTIGAAFTCTYSIRNNVDEAHDTLTITGLEDTVHSAGGDVSSGNAIANLKFEIGEFEPTFSTPPFCNGQGTGTHDDPFRNATMCTLPYGSRLNVQGFSHYTVKAADYELQGHVLINDARLTWHDLCDDAAHTGNSNCVEDPPTNGAGSQTIVSKLTPTVATTIHDAAHAAVTTVPVGTTVHDFVTVTGISGSPIPSGDVTVDWFLNAGCTGSPAATSAPTALTAAGDVDVTAFAFPVNSTGGRAFKAHYLGDGTYAEADGPCEPLQVVNAKISIAPNATNAVGQPHTFTVTVQKDTGSGFVAAQGEHVDVTLTDSNGAVHTAPTGTCTGAGANTDASGECTITFTSNSAGQVTGHATSTLSIGGISLAVQTNGVAPNSGDAVKSFVDARISITPNGVNPVGATHTFTAHVDVNSGGGFVPAPVGTQITFSIASGPGTLSGSPCATVGATGSCTANLTSLVPGTTVVNASTTLSVGGVSLTRTTNGSGGNSGPATKLWADAAVRTDVHNAAHGVITTAQPGDVVHDKVFVTKAAGTPASVPNPTGTVTFHRYDTVNCTGPSTDQTVPLGVDGTAESSTFTVVGDMSYKADYSGNANYPARSGACEPLTVQTKVCPSCPPPPCPAFPVFPGQPGPGGPCSFSVLEREAKGYVVEITIQNLSSNGDAALTALHLTWPTSNGALKSVVLDGQLYTGPALTGGSADLTFGGINPLLRTIKVGQSEKLRLVFEKAADTNTAHYSGSAEFGSCVVQLLP